MSSNKQLSYFENVDDINSIMGLTRTIRRTIEKDFKNTYNSFGDNDMITNINMRKNCQCRVNSKFENKKQLQTATNLMSQIVDEANKKVIDAVTKEMKHKNPDNVRDYRVKVEVLTTDSNNQLDGFSSIGTASDPKIRYIGDSSYPIHALKITVTNKPTTNN